MAVLLSVRPKWCELIASGKKTVEVRKTKPKAEPPFKCYIYCTKPSKKYQTISGCMVLNDDELYRHPTQGIKHGDSIELMRFDGDEYSKDNFLNGKVIGEFICAETECFTADYRSDEKQTARIAKQACLRIAELIDYQGELPCLYGWHISELVIYDKPKEIRDFCYPTEKYCEKEMCGGCPKDQVMGLDGDYAFDCEWQRPIKRPPQSWCYVQDLEE